VYRTLFTGGLFLTENAFIQALIGIGIKRLIVPLFHRGLGHCFSYSAIIFAMVSFSREMRLPDIATYRTIKCINNTPFNAGFQLLHLFSEA
jgi:heme A synthase